MTFPRFFACNYVWYRRWDSNPRAHKGPEGLSLLRMPLRHFGIILYGTQMETHKLGFICLPFRRPGVTCLATHNADRPAPC